MKQQHYYHDSIKTSNNYISSQRLEIGSSISSSEF